MHALPVGPLNIGDSCSRNSPRCNLSCSFIMALSVQGTEVASVVHKDLAAEAAARLAAPPAQGNKVPVA